MGIRFSAFFAFLAVLPAAPALAAGPQALPVETGKTWLHAPSGVRIPADAAGFKRTRASDFGSTQSDVSFAYASDAAQTVATVFIYRAGIPNVSIWAERADLAMKNGAQQSIGTLDMTSRLWSRFSPWSNSPNSGLRIVYAASGKDATATGLAVVQFGAWLIKVRMTSFKLTAAQMDAQLNTFVTALSLPTPKIGSGPAYAIKPCADALPGTMAKLVSPVNRASLKGATLTYTVNAEADEAKVKGGKGKAVVYCRDASSEERFGVYRADGLRTAYLIAAGDAGNTLLVGPDLGMQALDKTSRTYSATLLTVDRQYGFAPYQSMPTARQVIESLGSNNDIYVRSRIPGEEKNIEVF